jgi:hypothetical protein
MPGPQSLTGGPARSSGLSPVLEVQLHAFTITTGYGIEDREVGVRVAVESIIFSSPYRLQRLWAHPASYPMGTRD